MIGAGFPLPVRLHRELVRTIAVWFLGKHTAL
jgi:hypothetical protein